MPFQLEESNNKEKKRKNQCKATHIFFGQIFRNRALNGSKHAQLYVLAATFHTFTLNRNVYFFFSFCLSKRQTDKEMCECLFVVIALRFCHVFEEVNTKIEAARKNHTHTHTLYLWMENGKFQLWIQFYLSPANIHQVHFAHEKSIKLTVEIVKRITVQSNITCCLWFSFY